MAGADDELRNLRDAEDRIVALRLCHRFSDNVGMVEQVAGAMKAIGNGLDQRGQALVARLQANDATVSVADLYNTVRLVELVEGPEKADRLRLAGVKAMTG